MVAGKAISARLFGKKRYNLQQPACANGLDLPAYHLYFTDTHHNGSLPVDGRISSFALL
jgi:hypothetical protein